MVSNLKPRAAYESEETLVGLTREELLDRLLELRREFAVVNSIRNDLGTANARLVRRLSAIRDAVSAVDA